MRRFTFFSSLLFYLLAMPLGFAAPKKIALISGTLDSHPPGSHEYENNVLLLKHCLETSTNLAGVKCEVHFNGWPENPASLDDADTIMLTTGGSDRKETDHPLYVGDHFAQLEKQMQRGCGLVLLHWSTFHPSRFSEKVLDFAGGYFDYEKGGGGPTKTWFSKIETHDWTTQIASPNHPVCLGVKPFSTKEEFYFNLRFRENDPRLTRLLLNGLSGNEVENTVAWALQRENGGRSFSTTGGHFFTNWWNPDFRKLLLNALVWTARMEVPANGVESSLESFRPMELHKPISSLSKNVKPSLAAPTSAAMKTIVPANSQKEDDWKDNRANETVKGQFISSGVKGLKHEIVKGLSIRVGEHDEATLSYDTFLCNVRAGWTGGFLEFNLTRYGLLYNPTLSGKVQFASPPGAAWNGTPQYRGLFLNGKRVVLSYDLGAVSIQESPWGEVIDNTTVFTRTFELSASPSKQYLILAELKKSAAATNDVGGLSVVSLERDGQCVAAAANGDANVRFSVQNEQIVAEFPERDVTTAAKIFIWAGPPSEIKRFATAVKKSAPPEKLNTQPGKPRWNEKIETKGDFTFSQSEPYVVDTITVPYENPYKALMFLSGVDFFENGDAAVCTIHGDVWTVSGIDEKLQSLKWKRFATGLFQPLGLRIVKNEIYVLGRDQITRLHDRNQDGEADFYENFCNQIKTSIAGHDYVTSLEVDSQGNFYYVDPSGVHRVSSDGRKHETIAKGWRNPNGMSVSPDGIITVAPQEGNWTPSSAICEVKPGGFYGMGGPQVTPERPLGYDPPLCWIPRNVDNSSGSQVWVTSDRWGPLKDQLLSLSFGRCELMLVLRENVNGSSQGGVLVMKPKFLSGAMRGTFRKQDGQLYVVGSLGWQTSASRDGCFQRVRYTGQKVYLPTGLHIFQNGIDLAFSQPLDRETAEDTGSYGIEQWNYRYAQEYGSKEYSVASPNKVGHDAVDIKSAKLSSDGRSVFLEIPGVQPVMQMQIKFNLNAADGKTVRGEIYNTINQVGGRKNPSRT